MSDCVEDAHCQEVSPAASFPSTIAGGLGGYAFGGPIMVPFVLAGHGSGTGETNHGRAYVRTIRLRDWGPKGGQEVETMEREQVENPQASESLADRLERALRPIREPFGPKTFVQNAAAFLGSIGVVHVASLEIDGTHVYALQDEAGADFSAVAEKANAYLDSHGGAVRQIDLKVFGRSDYFFLEMVLTYRPVHSPHEPALAVAVGARPVVLHAMENETPDQYARRMETLRDDQAEATRFEKEVDDKGKELVRDLSYHISSAFPGARFTVVEQDESRDVL